MAPARFLSLAATVLVAASCSPGQPAPPTPGDAAAEIRAMLESSARAWNDGDLGGFLDDYAEDASFVTSAGLVHGSERIREIYERSYWRDGRGPEDALRFEDFDIRQVGPETAIAFGRFILYDRESGDAKATGTFSLTLRRGAEGWKIVHDHSSGDG